MPTPADTLWKLDAHSRGKHHILRRYIGAWLPIMTSTNPRVVIVDAFAGPGRYLDGEEGSPLILLRGYLDHSYRPKMRSEVVYLFIEERPDRVDHLRDEIAGLALPSNVKVDIECGTYQDVFGAKLDEIQRAGHKLAPTFAFVDPFGYSDAPMRLTGTFLQFARCEVLIYVPLPFVNRFVGRAGQDAAMTTLFGTERWTDAIPLQGVERYAYLHDLFRDQLRASGCTYVRSFEIDAGGSHGYHLFFGTRHERGLEKMKEAMWSLDPLGGQAFRDSTQSDQLVLFEQEVDTAPLLAALKGHFGSRRFTIEQAERLTLVDTPYAIAHLRGRTLVPAEQRGELEASGRSRARTYPSGTSIRFLR